MPNRRTQYKDQEKFKKTRNAQRERYYKSTAIYGNQKWYPEQDALILAHNMTDTQLSQVIQHSVSAIQSRRSRLKAQMKKEHERRKLELEKINK